MANLTNTVLLIALLLVATASLSECQVRVIARGLTCSNPSPVPLRPALSGANVRLSCNGGTTSLANTTTTEAGDFNMPVPTNPPVSPLTCRVFIDVPSNCTVGTIIRPVNALGSLVITPSSVQPLVFQATTFVAI